MKSKYFRFSVNIPFNEANQIDIKELNKRFYWIDWDFYDENWITYKVNGELYEKSILRNKKRAKEIEIITEHVNKTFGNLLKEKKYLKLPKIGKKRALVLNDLINELSMDYNHNKFPDVDIDWSSSYLTITYFIKI